LTTSAKARASARDPGLESRKDFTLDGCWTGVSTLLTGVRALVRRHGGVRLKAKGDSLKAQLAEPVTALRAGDTACPRAPVRLARGVTGAVRSWARPRASERGRSGVLRLQGPRDDLRTEAGGSRLAVPAGARLRHVADAVGDINRSSASTGNRDGSITPTGIAGAVHLGGVCLARVVWVSGTDVSLHECGGDYARPGQPSSRGSSSGNRVRARGVYLGARAGIRIEALAGTRRSGTRPGISANATSKPGTARGHTKRCTTPRRASSRPPRHPERTQGEKKKKKRRPPPLGHSPVSAKSALLRPRFTPPQDCSPRIRALLAELDLATSWTPSAGAAP